jgi:hypothetical protein
VFLPNTGFVQTGLCCCCHDDSPYCLFIVFVIK